MTEARRDGCNCRTMGCPLFLGLVWLVTFVSLVLCKAIIVCNYVIIVLIRLKQIDVKWLFVVINL
jgi:hypothetical protein